MRIAVVGTGYVGLVAGACFADTGNTVTCVDVDRSKIEKLRRNEIPIFEPGLDVLVERGQKEGRLFFTDTYEQAIADSEIIFLAVGTPPLPNGEPNLTYLKAASEEVARAMTGYRIIINKSTVPIGSHEVVGQWMKPHTRHPFHVASNPEFLKEGTAVDDFLRPDRVVLGTTNEEVFAKLASLYAPFVRQGNPIIRMDPVSAEMAKYACNSFLATRISFMNEMAQLCEKVGGDIEEIRRAMASDSRIGRHFLYAGAGYGGSCFPKDIEALLATGRKNDINLRVVQAAQDANAAQKRHLVTQIERHFSGKISGKTFGLWGLAFKPNTDDMREAPAITICNELLKAGARVKAFDPVARETAHQVLGDRIEYSHSAYDAIDGADALVLVTEWNEFRHPDFDRIRKSLRNPVVFDGRNQYNPTEMRQRGFTYYGIGRS